MRNKFKAWLIKNYGIKRWKEFAEGPNTYTESLAKFFKRFKPHQYIEHGLCWTSTAPFEWAEINEAWIKHLKNIT